jgi:hypothetical protein
VFNLFVATKNRGYGCATHHRQGADQGGANAPLGLGPLPAWRLTANGNNGRIVETSPARVQ